MKTKKIIFVGLIVSLTALSVMGKNNFDIGWSLLDDDTVTYSETQVKELVGKQLIQPVKECYTEANPHAFMTKCYSEMSFEFDHQYDWQISEDKEERVFYQGQSIYGDAIYTDCGVNRHIGRVMVDMDAKKVKVQESFFSDWVDAKAFTDSFCERVQNETNE